MVYDYLGDKKSNSAVCCSRHVLLPYSEAYSRWTCQVRSHIPDSRTLACIVSLVWPAYNHTPRFCTVCLNFFLPSRSCCSSTLFPSGAATKFYTNLSLVPWFLRVPVNRFHVYFIIKTACRRLNIMTFLFVSLRRSTSCILSYILEFTH